MSVTQLILKFTGTIYLYFACDARLSSFKQCWNFSLSRLTLRYLTLSSDNFTIHTVYIYVNYIIYIYIYNHLWQLNESINLALHHIFCAHMRSLRGPEPTTSFAATFSRSDDKYCLGSCLRGRRCGFWMHYWWGQGAEFRRVHQVSSQGTFLT